MAEDVLRRSGDQWFYLDGSGSLVYSELVELEGNYCYMNSAGAMVTNQWREIPNESPSDGERYRYRFRKSGTYRGAGVDGIDDGRIYIKGRLMTADRDARYEVFTYEDKDYLVSTSGTIMKNKNNIKDSDGMYYCTDNSGIVTYRGAERND